jgi:hypothetical protein
MDERIGGESIGEFGREQIEAARNHPRLRRGRGAMLADFWDAMRRLTGPVTDPRSTESSIGQPSTPPDRPT